MNVVTDFCVGLAAWVWAVIGVILLLALIGVGDLRIEINGQVYVISFPDARPERP